MYAETVYRKVGDLPILQWIYIKVYIKVYVSYNYREPKDI